MKTSDNLGKKKKSKRLPVDVGRLEGVSDIVVIRAPEIRSVSSLPSSVSRALHILACSDLLRSPEASSAVTLTGGKATQGRKP